MLTATEFIAKWQANQQQERATCQKHFVDLCHLLEEPTPNTDPTGATYASEKGQVKRRAETDGRMFEEKNDSHGIKKANAGIWMPRIANSCNMQGHWKTRHFSLLLIPLALLFKPTGPTLFPNCMKCCWTRSRTPYASVSLNRCLQTPSGYAQEKRGS